MAWVNSRALSSSPRPWAEKEAANRQYRKPGTADRELLERAKALMYQSGGLPIENSLNPKDMFLFDAESVELKK